MQRSHAAQRKMGEPLSGLGARAGFSRVHDADGVASFIPMQQAEIEVENSFCAMKNKQLPNT